MDPIIIIGNGISGITAARSLRKLSDAPITIISAETKYFYSRTALMYIYMGQMSYEDTKPYEDWFWDKNNLNLIQDFVDDIDTQGNSIRLRSGQVLPYTSLILACGSTPNTLAIPGHDLDGVTGLYTIQDLRHIETLSLRTKVACIIGGGLIGIEMAEMLYSKGIDVHLIVRESSYWSGVLPLEESMMISDHIRDHGIHLHTEAEASCIHGDEDSRVSSITLHDNQSFPTEMVGITIGVGPNIQWLQTSEIATNKGILVDPYLRTNIPNVYAIGDCAELQSPERGRRSIEAVWYTGRMMGETVAQTIAGNPTEYSPRLWYNSAKFLDIEYQVYGKIQATIDASDDTFFWKHPSKNISFRIQYDRASRRILGFNLLGMRFRHEQCHDWITSKSSIDHVLKNLHKGFFDPEFYTNYHKDILEAYHQYSGVELSLDKSTMLSKIKRIFS